MDKTEQASEKKLMPIFPPFSRKPKKFFTSLGRRKQRRASILSQRVSKKTKVIAQ
jgi:hypothetical protein